MGRFDGILICTDLDGTLLKDDKSISKENLDAIEYFKNEGGYFTFVTGRMPYYVGYIYEKLDPSAPFGCSNGGGLYDHRTQKYVWKHPLSDNIRQLLAYIENAVPETGIQITTFDKAYFHRDTPHMERFRQITGIPFTPCHYNDITSPIAKILFGAESEEIMTRLIDCLHSHPLSTEFTFVRSSKSLYEVIPKDIGKGTAIEKLAEYLNIDIKNTIAVGDYDNDISMLETAGLGVAVANACESAKKAADLITVSNEEHAIAHIIYDLDNGIIKL